MFVTCFRVLIGLIKELYSGPVMEIEEAMAFKLIIVHTLSPWKTCV